MIGSPRIRLVSPDESASPASLEFDDVFRRYARYVGSIGIRLLGRPEEVEDFVQDVFLRVHRGLHRVQNVAAIKGWLASIAVRLALRHLRRRRLMRLVSLDSAFDYASVVDPSLLPEERSMLAELYRRLDDVPAQKRLAWTLRHVEGERLEEVARLCDCSIATAKRWILAAQEAMTPGGLDE